MAGTYFGEGAQQAPTVYKLQRDIERDAIEDLKLKSQAQDDIQKSLIKELLFLPTVETEADKLARDRSTIDMQKIQSFWNPIKGQLGFSTDEIADAAKNLTTEQREHFKQNPADAEKFFNDYLIKRVIDKAPKQGVQYQQVPVESPKIGFNLSSPELGLNLSGISPEADRGPASLDMSIPQGTEEMINRGLSLPMRTSLPESPSGQPFFNKAEQDILGKMIEAEIIRGKSMVGLAKQGVASNSALWKAFWEGINDTYSTDNRPKKGSGSGKKDTFDEKLILKIFSMSKEELDSLGNNDPTAALEQIKWVNKQQAAWPQIRDPVEKERFRKAILSVTLGRPEARTHRANIFGEEAPGRKETPPSEKPQASNKQMLRDAVKQSQDLKGLMKKMLEDNAKKNRK